MMLRLKMAWAILRGRPVGYRVRVEGLDAVSIGLREPYVGGFLVDCEVIEDSAP